jgi:hypothetical protein
VYAGDNSGIHRINVGGGVTYLANIGQVQGLSIDNTLTLWAGSSSTGSVYPVNSASGAIGSNSFASGSSAPDGVALYVSGVEWEG